MLSGLRHCGRLKLPFLPPSIIQECASCPAVDQPTWSSIRLLKFTIFRRGLRHASSGGFCEQSFATSTNPSSRSAILFPAGLAVRNVVTEGTLAKQVRESSTMTKATLEHRTDFFQASKQENQDHVLIVLNYSLPNFVPRIWEQSRLRICADGGANRMYDELPGILKEEDPSAVRTRYIPDAIIGDLDSLRPEVREFYTQHKVPVIDLAHDQDTSDLHKCINYAQDYSPGLTPQSKILVVGAVGGRLDHQLSNIHILYKFKELRIVLLGRGNLALLLPEPFEHVLFPDRGTEGPICALIPVGTPVKNVYTSGLRWNLEGRSLQFGELISTSNEMKYDRITVKADGPLLWTTELTLT